MQLIEQGSRFVAVSTYEERDIPKAAGFRWDPAKKQWWTDRQDKAARLAQFAPDPLRTRLIEATATETAQRQETIVASRATDAAIDIPAPPGLEYLPYQKAGIAFAAARSNVLIGDDMGLGKTIQAIGLYNSEPNIHRVLIICPASLKLNWRREWRKWSIRRAIIGIAEGGNFPVHGTDIVICNYDIVARNRRKIDEVEWDLLILDECHMAKNAKAQRTRAIVGGGKRGGPDRVEPIRAKRRLWLTGTPILNRPCELWTTVHHLDPRGLGADFWYFHKHFCDAKNNGYGWDFSGASHLDELQVRLRESIMIRRLKADVLTELPPKRRQLIELDPGTAAETVRVERSTYESAQDHITTLRAQAELAEAAEDQEAYAEAVAKLRSAQQALFSEISKLRHQTALAKVPAVIEHVREAIEASGKIVLFAHHLDVVSLIAKEFPGECVTLTGQTQIVDRQAAVDRFQTDPTCRLFIGNILAAGVGITLTAASHVVFAELDWRPGIVTQAEDRLHRIGQAESVLVQHLVFDGSIDAVMAQTILRKQEVIDKALDLEGDGPIEAEPDFLAEAIAAASQASSRKEGPEAPVPPRRETPLPEMDADQIAAVQRNLSVMAGWDTDRATAINGIGFNKFDGLIGHDLASRSWLSVKQAALGRKILRKYRRQLGEDAIRAMG